MDEATQTRLAESQINRTTGVMRFDFQIAAAAHAVEANGIILNVGCNEDPADLRARFGSFVVNCDLMAFDEGMGRPNVVDKVFDCTQFPWPFEDDYAHTVLLGDILEHMPFDVIVDILKEARRVGKELAITIPTDTRIDETLAQKNWQRGQYNEHTIVATIEVIDAFLQKAGWHRYIGLQADWGFGTVPPVMGYCVMANRG